MKNDSPYLSTCGILLPPGPGQRQQIRCGDEGLLHRGGWVRVACAPDRAQFWLQPDEGPRLGPFIAPAIAQMEAPCLVTIERTDPGPTQLAVIVSWGPGAVLATPDRTATLAAGVVLPLETWERWVSIDAPLVTGEWLDAAGVVIGTFAGIASRRPPLAAAIRLPLLAATVRLDTWP